MKRTPGLSSLDTEEWTSDSTSLLSPENSLCFRGGVVSLLNYRTGGKCQIRRHSWGRRGRRSRSAALLAWISDPLDYSLICLKL